MILPDGRVMIAQGRPLDTQDFQRLYLGEGRTPEAAASYIHNYYPSEVKSKMHQDWMRSGITEAPERYFSNPTNIRPLEYGTPAVLERTRARLQPLQPAGGAPNQFQQQLDDLTNAGFPMQAAAAKLAMAEKEAEAGRMVENAPINALARSFSNIPLPLAGDAGAELLRRQTSGDAIGFAKKFLIKQTIKNQKPAYRNVPMPDIVSHFGGPKQIPVEMPRMTMENFYSRPEGRSQMMPMPAIARMLGGLDEVSVEPDPTLFRPEVKPYIGQTGVGAITGEHVPDRLDRELFDDPEFQDIYAKNPQLAEHYYQRLKGRSLAGDLSETQGLRKERLEEMKKFAYKAQAEGARFNPSTGKWMVWNINETEPVVGQLTQPRPYRQLVPATEWQAKALNTYTPQGTIDITKMRGHKEMQARLQQLQPDPEWDTFYQQELQNYGGFVLPAEFNAIADKYQQAKIQRQAQPTSWDAAMMFNEGTVRSILGQPIESDRNLLEDLFIPKRGGDAPEYLTPLEGY